MSFFFSWVWGGPRNRNMFAMQLLDLDLKLIFKRKKKRERKGNPILSTSLSPVSAFWIRIQFMPSASYKFQPFSWERNKYISQVSSFRVSFEMHWMKKESISLICFWSWKHSIIHEPSSVIFRRSQLGWLLGSWPFSAWLTVLCSDSDFLCDSRMGWEQFTRTALSPIESRVKSHDVPLHSEDGTAHLPRELAELLESEMGGLGAIQVTVLKHRAGSTLPGSLSLGFST